MTIEGKLEKMEVDYTETVDRIIPECQQTALDGKLNDAVQQLMSLEKQTRLAGDMISTGKLLVAIVKLCFEAKEWDMLNDNIVVITKKRSQLKQAVAKMVQECYKYVDQTPDMDTKLKLIDTLRTVTEGKIYVEIERAASILQELQVETFGSMERKEKVEFILEQMRLCLAKKDYIRCQIISKKISIKFFVSEDEEIQKLKLRYYQMMIELDLSENSYLSTCKHFKAVFDTPMIQSDVTKWQQALKSVVLYVILAPYDNEQSDTLERIRQEKKLEDMPLYKSLLQSFVSQEVMQLQKVKEIYRQELRHGTPDSPCTDVFPSTDEGNARWKDFANRVVEHNIRIMAKYYTRITTKRMSELLDLSIQEAEDYLSKLVVNKTVYAKIDRLDGVITFCRPKDPSDVLTEWSHNVNQLMSLVNKTTHLISKEEMIHNLK